MPTIFIKFYKPLLYGATGTIGTGICIPYCFGRFYQHEFTVGNIGKFLRINGNSMYPTIQDGDVIWATRCHNLDRLKEGDIVTFPYPFYPRWTIMKRITTIRKEQMEMEVHGDNREFSTDSRHFGPVNLALCRHKAQFRVYPLGKMGWIE